jgi:2'-hydroxyisoflavone reductase
MKLLILGGTRFLGRHLAGQALAQGHQVSLLHRGLSNAQLFPEAEHLITDRDKNLSCLSGKQWDAVIDTSAYVPRQVRQVVQALGDRVGHYQLVSTISVYAGFALGGNDETAALATLPDPNTETVDGSTYGGLKVLCEQEAQLGFGNRCLINRPGLLVGPHDPTGRFTWWVRRFTDATVSTDNVLAPGDPQAPVQFIDAGDAAAWMLVQAERGTTGIFNLTGPATPLTMGEFLETARVTLRPQATLRWLPEALLLAHKVAPWTELPVWLSEESAALHRTKIQRALQTGLTTRPLRHTLLDTAAWLPQAPPTPKIGMTAEREATVRNGNLSAFDVSA